MHLRSSTFARLRRRFAGEGGFTMLFALLALFVGGLLVAAAFTAANGDIKLTRRATLQTKAYYAALAGVQRYQYQLTSNPNYWIECSKLGTEEKQLKVPSTTDEMYYVKTLGSAGHASCEANKQATILETTGAAKGTFRVLSIGKAGSGATAVSRSIVATFAHPGFTKYVYESNFEVEDPTNFSPEPSGCEHYYEYRKKNGLTKTCPPIEFAPQDRVNGPMHTNDAAEVCKSGGSAPTFGRNSEDPIEMNGGHYAANGCTDEPNILGKYSTEAGSLLPPETDAELLEAAGYKFSGRTVLVLKPGSPNTITVTNKGSTTTKNFPTNGVIYVENSNTGCGVAKYTPFGSDVTNDTGCGNVYVSGSYTESLTIASANDVIVNGNLTTTGEANGEPTGGATLGLIAENFVRLYHPVQESYEVEHYTPKREVAFGKPKLETCLPVKYKAKITNKSTTVTFAAAVEGLAVGLEVTGSNIPAGTKITKVESTTKVIISKEATSTKETELTFTREGTTFEYHSTIKECVAKIEAGYTFHDSDKVAAKPCNTFEFKEEPYLKEGTCEPTNTAKGCDAENLNSAEDPNHWGSRENPIIDAAILSTKHSWIVDNYKCGEPLGKLNVWGSIAQFWRGPVGTGGGNGTGYIKNYNYDERLAAQQPPSFLSPTSTSWKLSRETAPPTGFTGP